MEKKFTIAMAFLFALIIAQPAFAIYDGVERDGDVAITSVGEETSE